MNVLTTENKKNILYYENTKFLNENFGMRTSGTSAHVSKILIEFPIMGKIPQPFNSEEYSTKHGDISSIALVIEKS